jgi:PPM family protein phosphatase
MDYFADTDIGKYREKNEDYFYASDDLFIVADGMGGHRAGEVASKLAVETFVREFKNGLSYVIIDKNPEETAKHSGINNIQEQNIIKELLINSIKISNKEVFKKAYSLPEYYGMGTTLTACYINNNEYNITHIGDSRLYIKRGDELNLLTSDHTITGELLRKGEISYEEAFDHPQRNYLTNVIGVAEEIKPDYYSCKTLPEDIIIICSDGLSSMLRDKEILNIINKNKKIRDITKNLIKEAIKKGGMDNITIIAIKI